MKKSTILVTGSEGFIGSHLMKALGDRGIRYDTKLDAKLDINDPAMLESIIRISKPTVIVHLAALSSNQIVNKNPELAMRTNIIGTFNVLRIAKKYHIRVLLASSAATDRPELSLYGTTKECMERLAVMFDNVSVLRFYNVYGPRSKSVVNKFIKALQYGKKICLNGNTTRDYIYVDDVIAAILKAADSAHCYRWLEVGTGRSTSLRTLANTIAKALNRETYDFDLLPAIQEIQRSKCNNATFYKTSLLKGIKKIIYEKA